MVSYLCISTIREIGFKGDGSHFVTLTIGVSSVFNNAFNFSLPLLYRTHCKLAFCVLWPRCGHREAIELTGMAIPKAHRSNGTDILEIPHKACLRAGPSSSTPSPAASCRPSREIPGSCAHPCYTGGPASLIRQPQSEN